MALVVPKGGLVRVVLAKAKAAREPVAQVVVPAAAKVGRNDQTSAILPIRRNVKTKTSLLVERRLICLAVGSKRRVHSTNFHVRLKRYRSLDSPRMAAFKFLRITYDWDREVIYGVYPSYLVWDGMPFVATAGSEEWRSYQEQPT
ncbi:MAG: hypothetical protein RI957_567 [Verrucomicrobiota bacterium]|jgi:hypothetical protein